MNKNPAHIIDGLKTELSFEPLFNKWKEIIENGGTGSTSILSQFLETARQNSSLSGTITDLKTIQENAELVQQFMSTVFPVALSDNLDLFAAAIPFTYNAFFASHAFGKNFLDENGFFAYTPEGDTATRLLMEKKASAYQLILKQHYNIDLKGQILSVYPYQCRKTGLERFMEVEIDTRFVEVVAPEHLPEMPEEIRSACSKVSDVMQSPEVMQWLKISDFRFRGFSIVVLKDVTEREIINNIKSTLLNLESFTEVDTFAQLQLQVQDLIGVAGLKIGITPFYRVNDEVVFLDVHEKGSILLPDLPAASKKDVALNIEKFFRDRRDPVFIPSLNADEVRRLSFLEGVVNRGWCCLIIWPLFDNGRFLGTLEIATANEDSFDMSIMPKVEPAIALFELALKRSAVKLGSQIDKVIKDQFTAIQPAVEWRFIRAALNYLQKSQYEDDAKMEPVVFDQVFPLYGAIDIRNSSTERNQAIQKDLLEQLSMAGDVIRKARKKLRFPLLKELAFKIRKHTHAVSNIVLSDDETAINNFLKKDVLQFFSHLRETEPWLKEDIDKYLSSVSTNVDMLYHHRKMFDESVTRINSTLARFIDNEQLEAQQVYPHYFERFATDGVDFNVYLGQSICPGIPFNPFYLKNIKLWQLTVLAKAARLSRKLQDSLPLHLQTTQLVLAHSFPISISFRPAERKFDVDGAYNIRYEIVKKRIDKVHILNTNERLTKPGTVAIVYSQLQEATEYLQYVEYLQHEGLFGDKVEMFDLEELQGVAGLKAIRVQVSFDEMREAPQMTKEQQKIESNRS